MKKHLFTALGVICLALFAPSIHKTNAAELVVNGGFETGSFSSWTVTNVTTNVWFNWTVSGPYCGHCINQWTTSTSPHSGSFSAWNGFAAGNPIPSSYRLRQTIAIPNNPNEGAILRWWDRIQWDLVSFATAATSTLPQFVIVSVLNTSGVVLQELYRLTVPAFSRGPSLLPGQGWVQHSKNLTAYKGQTIQIEFQCYVAQNTIGPGSCEFDDVSLQTFSTTSANVSVSGRVTDANGASIVGARTTLQGGDGIIREAVTNPFGYYVLEDVPAGGTYVVEVRRKGFDFTDNPRVISIGGALTELNFQAAP